MERALVEALTSIHSPEISLKSKSAFEEIRGAQQLKVLLVEDIAANQETAVLILERLGVSARVASNGKEAVDLATTTRYDLIIMDVHMPEMDGLEATRRIRQHEKSTGARSQIVALTASVMREETNACLASGMDSVLSKPLRIQELIFVLRAAVARRS
jgi:CheY-like chemotaxis protein